MAQRCTAPTLLYACATACGLFATYNVRADDASDTKKELQELKQENRELKEQMRRQAELIECLTRTVGEIKTANAHQVHQMDELQNQIKEGTTPAGSSV